MLANIVSGIGAFIALAVLLLMSLSSVLPEIMDRVAARRGASTAGARVSPRAGRFPGNAGSSGPARRTAAGSVRGTGSHSVLPAGPAGSLPW